ncbi:glycosyltransferase family 4 protein [Pseudohongiella spirulinae]|uniref:Putative glycosyl transferase n=1 Tax=Pseudohongiella spirulinae TaxID=1249552 RepID=A0A0S2KC66_9GAMM|nr:glycosyltransferase family 4 protein [Pseudohongiella spirulinae]ALO45801.1 Putative glycosyl transferase [Pseudohongiella spirulinae]
MGIQVYFIYPGDLDTATGGYRYDRRLINELRELGIKVETIALSARFPFPDARALEHAAHTLGALPSNALVIIDGLAYGAMHELVEANTKRLQIVALCHHPLALESGLTETQKNDFQYSETMALQAARAVIVTSPHTATILQSDFSVPAQKIVAALPGTDAVEFAPCNGNPLVLLTVASLTRRKAHDVLIDALASVQELEWQARFVGGEHFDPKWASQLRQQVNQLGLQQRIDFAGSVDDLLIEYQSADVFVLPSRFEGYGMVFAEALAAGLPVVAASTGAVPDVVPPKAGLLVPADDVAALSSALRRLLTDKKLRKKLQTGARQTAANLPGWRHSALKVTALLNKLTSDMRESP